MKKIIFLNILVIFICLSACANVEKNYSPSLIVETEAPVKYNKIEEELKTKIERSKIFEVDVVAPEKVWAGEPFVISFKGKDIDSIEVTFGNKKILAELGKNGQAEDSASFVLPVKLKEKNKQLPLKVLVKGKNQAVNANISFPVDFRTYPEQHLTVSKKYVYPSKEEQAKIARDRKLFGSAIRPITNYKYWNLPLKRPVIGSISSVYGLRRFFNGEERNPHKGIDFRGAAGSSISAVESGKVVLVDGQYYGGNTVVVDHGLGLYSAYLHLSKFAVKKGQEIKRDDVVGYIGSTGRSTGPHLHLSIIVMGESVNPAVFIEGMQEESQID